MNLKASVVTFLSLFIFLKVNAQDCPPNIDFEMGDFTNWQCATGFTSTSGTGNNITLTPSGPIADRHVIISSANAGKDFYGGFPTLCPYGGKYSVKLGNDQVGQEAEGISYTFTVPATVDTFTFTYFYAVVFENPDHALPEQPRFFVTAYDVASGEVVNCASYDYVSTGSLPGFESAPGSNGSILYKNWTPTSLQFAGLQGKAVRLEFKTADCTLGGHFGYAYLDVASGCTNILATAPYCIETNSLILNAPYGFQSYTWWNDDYSAIVGKQQSITFSPPPVNSGSFHVDAIPYPGYGCRDTFNAVVKPLPVPDTPQAKTEYTFCQFQGGSTITATATPGHDLVWYTAATGGIGTNKDPVIPTGVPGVFVYYVSQKALFGCEGFRRKITANVIPNPNASFNANTTRQCQNGNQFIFTSTSTNLFAHEYNWDMGDGKIITSTTNAVVNYTYSNPGNFIVQLKMINGGTCSTSKQITVTVVPKPIASFTYPPIVCEKQTTLITTDNSTVPVVSASINKWWWNINGNITITQNPLPFVPVNPGPLPIKMVVTTAEGCVSDTNKTTIPVRYRPNAAFKFGTLLCNNEVINFTNLSSLPPSAVNESIVKWNWQFDNPSTAFVPNPNVVLKAGVQHATLVTETNYGCKSVAADSIFEIFAKPSIKLTISDSCVLRTIYYNAVDVSNTVDKWYWNFGNGLSNGEPAYSKTFKYAGDQSLILLATTTHQCKDTVVRPFTIYDNKAFAGRDTIAAMDEPVQLNANGYAGTTYAWSPSTGLDLVNTARPVATLNREQLYTMDAVTKEGCEARSKILIKRYKGPSLYIPNAFSPNNDGRNDVLRVFAVGIKSFNYFAVYDRYGKLVYRTSNPANGWDGTVSGRQAATGTFVAIAQAIDYKGRVIMNKETVVLVR
jgi:gliding motility-associated-like protein